MDESVRKIAHDVAYQGDKSSIGQLVVTSLRIKWLDSSEIPRFEAAYASLKKCVINKATDAQYFLRLVLDGAPAAVFELKKLGSSRRNELEELKQVILDSQKNYNTIAGSSNSNSTNSNTNKNWVSY